MARKDEVDIMCTMRVAVRREMLGAREQAWSIWTGKNVAEMTSKEIKSLIQSGTKVCGLKIGKDGLELDKQEYFTTNIMEHRHCNNFRPMVESDSMANVMYTVIGSHEEKGKTAYDCISSQFEQLVLNDEEIRIYLKLGLINSGAKLDGDKIAVASLEYEKKAEAPKAEEKKPVVKVETPKAKTDKK